MHSTNHPGAIPNPTTPASTFNEALERVSTGSIVSITPDEYIELAHLSHEDARELPDGMYVVDDTLRERLAEAGVTYDLLNRKVFSEVFGTAFETKHTEESSEDSLAARRLLLGKQNSAHGVFFGTLQFQGQEKESTHSVTAAIAIKPHHERGSLSAKPFGEIGKLALLQGLGHKGIYKPVGVLKSGNEKFVMTEMRPGIQTLDTYRWYGRRNTRQERQGLTRDQLEALHGRDVEVIAQVVEMLGTVHAEGIFHGDAQMKNIGWTQIETASEEDPEFLTSRTGSSDFAAVSMTLLDLENATIFLHKDGEFEDGYHEELVDLASRDILQFFTSVPRASRVPRGKHTYDEDPTSGYDELFVELYMTAFFNQRAKVIPDEDPEQIKNLQSKLQTQILDVIRQVNKDDVGGTFHFDNTSSHATSTKVA